MCVPLNDSLKAFAAFLHRCKGFADDGYKLVFSHQGETLWYYRYRHHNGHTIELKLYTKELRILQLTDGRETYNNSLRQS